MREEKGFAIFFCQKSVARSAEGFLRGFVSFFCWREEIIWPLLKFQFFEPSIIFVSLSAENHKFKFERLHEGPKILSSESLDWENLGQCNLFFASDSPVEKWMAFYDTFQIWFCTYILTNCRKFYFPVHNWLQGHFKLVANRKINAIIVLTPI